MHGNRQDLDDSGTAELRRRIAEAERECERLRSQLMAARTREARCEERFRHIIERTADAIVVVEPTGRVRFVNHAAVALLGRSEQDLLAHDFGIPVSSGETTELELVRPDREQIAVEMRVVATEWDGRAALLASLRDITDRRREEAAARRLAEERAARAAAQEAERRASLLAEASRVLTDLFDPDVALERLARIAVENIADVCVIDLLQEDGSVRRHTVAHAVQRDAPAAANLRRHVPGPDSVTMQAVRSGESILIPEVDASTLRALVPEEAHYAALEPLGPVAVLAAPLAARGRVLGAALFLATSRSGSRFRPVNAAFAEELAGRAALALDNARLYEASLLASEAKSDFLAMISHELRTPLNAVIGYSDLLLDGIVPCDRETVDLYLSRVRTSARHLNDLIDDILRFEKVQSARERISLEQVRLDEVIRTLRAHVEPLATEKGLSLSFLLPDADTVIETDGDKLCEILAHVITNALKFTDVGGVRLEVRTSENQILFEISDTGEGIAPEFLERIFDPFWQVERARTRRTGGTGIGLSVARHYARLLGGDIRVTRAGEEGSTFTVYLPLRPVTADESKQVGA